LQEVKSNRHTNVPDDNKVFVEPKYVNMLSLHAKHLLHGDKVIRLCC